MPFRRPSFSALLAPTLTKLELVRNETGLLKPNTGGGKVDGGRGVGWGVPRRERGWAQDRPRSGGQERSSGRQTQEGKTYDSKPNRNQATADRHQAGRGGPECAPPPTPPAPFASFPLHVLGKPAGVVSRQHCLSVRPSVSPAPPLASLKCWQVPQECSLTSRKVRGGDQ